MYKLGGIKLPYSSYWLSYHYTELLFLLPRQLIKRQLISYEMNTPVLTETGTVYLFEQVLFF